MFCSIPGAGVSAVINLTVADYTNAVMGAGYGSKKTRDGVISCAAYRDLRVPYAQAPPSQTDDIELATDVSCDTGFLSSWRSDFSDLSCSKRAE